MTIKSYNTPLSEAICKLIEASGMKQSAVALKAGYGVREFNDMLNGWRIIKACDIPGIAEALGVTPNVLYGLDTGQPEQAS